jgi:multicomponent Na+:H+ antiporter subunit E
MDTRRIRILAIRAACLAVLWWVLTQGDVSSWLFGGPVIAIIAGWPLLETAKTRVQLRPWELVRFVPVYLWRSFTGSCDVTWRAMHWRLPISPALRPFVFRLPPDSAARVFCANCFNLLPGTLTASWNQDTLLIHLLVDGPKPMAGLRDLEERVGLIFGHELMPEERGDV